MSVDGFRTELAQPFVGYDDRVAARFWARVDAVNARLGVAVSGLENVPESGALFVMNHAFGWDAMLPMAAVRRQTGRRVWALGEHLWWKLPFLRTLAAGVGTVDGTPEHAHELLSAGELVMVMPGGMREALKPEELRYHLVWGERMGFVRSAFRAGVPIVPVAAVGSDELFTLVGDSFARGRRWLHRDFPLPRFRWGHPWARLHELSYSFGEPIEARRYPDESEEHMLRRVRNEVRGAIEGMIEDALSARVLS